MLDVAGILFSSVIILIVIVRALQADREQPWFQKTQRKTASLPDESPGWQRKQ